jgi:hypothetical protein
MELSAFQERFRQQHEWAKECRDGSFKEGRFLPHVLIINPDEKMLMICCPWSNDAEKRMLMQHVWEEARKQKAIAVILSSDARKIQSKAYCDHFKIPHDQFVEHRDVELRRVGGSFGDLPQEVWRDCILSTSMSPCFPDMHLSTSYVEGPDDTVQYEAEEAAVEGEFHFKMIRPWWDEQKAAS